MKSIENPVILGIIKKTHPFFEQPVFHGKYLRVLLRSSYGCFGKHNDWVVGFSRGTGRRAAACLAEIEGGRFNSDLRKFAKNERRTHKTSGSLNGTHFGGGSPTIQIHVFLQFSKISLT